MTQAHPAENKLRGVQGEVGAMSDSKGSSSKSDSSRGSGKDHSAEDPDEEEGGFSGELTTQEQAAAKRIADWAGDKKIRSYELNLMFI